MAAARAALFALALCLAAGTGRGESYHFLGEEIDKNSLKALYKFYVYATDSGDPLAVGRQPYIEFSSFGEVPREAQPTSGELETGGLQVSLIPYGKFYSFVNPEKPFCSENLLKLDSPGAAEHVFSFKVPVRVAADTPDSPTPKLGDSVRINITRTDVYYLVISNCGPFQQATFHGRVAVTNAFGSLPGDSFYRMGFYGVLTCFYTFLAVLWILMVCCWKSNGGRLHHLHHCISFILSMSVIEAFFSWYFMLDWNRSSERSEKLFILNIMVTVLKFVFSYTLMLVTSLGWGVTRPDLEMNKIVPIHVLVLLYWLLHVVWELMSFYRHAYDISNGTLLKVFLPELLVNVFFFVWILRALGRISGELEGDSRSMFKKIRGLLILALCGSLPISVMQLMDLTGVIHENMLPRRTAFKWHYQWLLFDGTGQIIFGLVLLGTMCQWAPQNDTNKYMYQAQIDQEEENEANADRKDGVVADAPPDSFAISNDEADDLEDDLEVDVAGRHDGAARPGPPPDVLGSALA